MAEGIQLRLTHTGRSASFILIDDLKQQGVPRGKPQEPIYIPAPTTAIPNPFIDITYGGLVPFSFETGDIRGYLLQGDLTVQFLVGQPADGIVVVTEASYTIRPGDTTILVNRTVAGAVSLSLPIGASHTGHIRIIDVKGDAATNNVTIIAAVGQTINGGATAILKVNSGILEAVWRSPTVDWFFPVTAFTYGFSWQQQWAAAPVDTVRNRSLFPLNGGQVVSIKVASIGVVPTAGSIAFQAGSGAGGNTLLNAATFDLTTLVANPNPGDNNSTAMTLTGTLADLQGDLGDGITVEVVNVDQPISVLIVFGDN